MSPKKEVDPADVPNPTLVPPQDAVDAQQEQAAAEHPEETPPEALQGNEPAPQVGEPGAGPQTDPPSNAAPQPGTEPQVETSSDAPNSAVVQEAASPQPEQFVVTGSQEVDGHQPGETFSSVLTPNRRQMLVEGGHIAPASEVQTTQDQ